MLASLLLASTAALPVAAAPPPVPLPPAAARAEVEIYWKGRTRRLEDLETSLSPAVVEALRRHVARYTEWIDEFSYEVGVSEDGRVLLVTESVPTLRDRMKLVEKSLVVFDELLAPPDRASSDETFGKGGFGEGDHVPHADPIVLFEVDTPDAYKALAARLGELEPVLSDWAASQALKPGFFEGRVPAAGWQRIPRDFDLNDVWRTKNELVNRLARMALQRSYGPQPTWFSVGVAWAVEMEVMGTIFSFPYRSDFVGVVEHEGWKAELRSSFKKRKKDPLRLAEFVPWPLNTWDAERAGISWGVVQFLALHRTDALPQIAEDFRGTYKAGFRQTNADGTWSTNPGFEISEEDQLRVMEAHAGDGLLDMLTEFLRTWKKPRKRR